MGGPSPWTSLIEAIGNKTCLASYECGFVRNITSIPPELPSRPINENTPEMTSRKIQAVVFDLDGLMFNTENLFHLAGNELLQRRGHAMTPELLSRMMGRRPNEAFAIMVGMLNLNEEIPDLLAESEEIFAALLETQLEPMPGLFELLDHIEQRDLQKAVATSSRRDYLHDVLARFELGSRFHLTLTAEDVREGKPHPEIYLTAAKQLGVAPEQMLVLEDSEAGTRAAAAANAVIVSIPHEHSQAHDFSAATYVAESLVDPYVLDLIHA